MVLKECENKDKGCPFVDKAYKTELHSRFQCEYRDTCDYCRSKLEGTLEEHYRNVHADITFTAGEFFTQTTRSFYRHIMIISEFGRLHCFHKLHDVMFELNINSPILGDELPQYNVVVELQNPVTGDVRRDTAPYSYLCDWQMDYSYKEFIEFVKKGDFIIKINISKRV